MGMHQNQVRSNNQKRRTRRKANLLILRVFRGALGFWPLRTLPKNHIFCRSTIGTAGKMSFRLCNPERVRARVNPPHEQPLWAVFWASAAEFKPSPCSVESIHIRKLKTKHFPCYDWLMIRGTQPMTLWDCHDHVSKYVYQQVHMFACRLSIFIVIDLCHSGCSCSSQ